MKLLPIILGAVVGVGVGVMYLTQSIPEEEEWAYVPKNAADWQENRRFALVPEVQEQQQAGSLVLEEELAPSVVVGATTGGVPEALFSEEELAAMLEQEQHELE